MKYTLLTIILFSLIPLTVFSQEQGTRIYGKSIRVVTSDLMKVRTNSIHQIMNKRNSGFHLNNQKHEITTKSFEQMQQVPQIPLSKGTAAASTASLSLGLSFTAVTSTETGKYYADPSGAVGPTQFLVVVEGKIKTFNKSTGIADGVMDINPDVFFASALTPASSGDVTSTYAPNIKYDRLSSRWFLTMVDITLNTSGYYTKANRILIAVSDGSVISPLTVWTISYFQNSASEISDSPTLGIDADALYIGTNQFTLADCLFTGTNGYVVNKASLYTGTPVVTVFTGLVASEAGSGPFHPCGVDNYDPANTGPTAVGYFIGNDNAVFSNLVLRRVSNPGGTPTISDNISLPVPATTLPNNVEHLGNTGGANGYLGGSDDRLYSAHIRNNRLWTAHHFRLSAAGVANTTAAARNGIRWYEINVPASGSPALIQSGTIYDNVATRAAAHQYFYPSIMVSGQGNAAIGFSAAGAPYYINAAVTSRLSTDPSGTMDAVSFFTSSSTAYNPAADPGGVSGRMWGRASTTCLDPGDDMTMWTLQEYCSSTDVWGVKAIRLSAPPPATPVTSTPASIASNVTSVDVTITGSVVNGSGFFDPGAGFSNRITASVSGGIVVNSVTYKSPTEIVLNINTNGVADGTYFVTVTNPDGQSATSTSGIIQVDHSLPVEMSLFDASVLKDGGVKLDWCTETEVNNYGFDIERTTSTGSNILHDGWVKIGFVEGQHNSNNKKNYSFIDKAVSCGNYVYRLKQIDNDGKFQYSKTVEVRLENSSVFGITKIFPNPFNPNTKIIYSIPVEEKVTLKIFDMLGREIATLVDEVKPAGEYQADFDASKLTSGVYLSRIATGKFTQTKKMILTK